MINKVAFTGRETMLTDGLQKASQKAEDFVASSSVLPSLPKVKTVKPLIKEAEYTSPFAPTGNPALDEVSEEIAKEGNNLDIYM